MPSTCSRKRYILYDWNKSIPPLTVPWYHFRGKMGDIKAPMLDERSRLLNPMSFTTINSYSSKNKADSKYQNIKRQFPYFVTIPEEEEEQEQRIQTKNKLGQHLTCT